jgi:hypothetical protein
MGDCGDVDGHQHDKLQEKARRVMAVSRVFKLGGSHLFRGGGYHDLWFQHFCWQGIPFAGSEASTNVEAAVRPASGVTQHDSL